MGIFAFGFKCTNQPTIKYSFSIARIATDLDNSDQQVHNLHIWNLETLKIPLIYFLTFFCIALVVMNGSIRGRDEANTHIVERK